MEPGEKFVRRLLALVVVVVALIVSIVFEEFHGKGWIGLLIFVIGAAIGGLGIELLKNLRR